MKTKVWLVCLLAFMCSCSMSREEKAQALIKSWVYKHLPNYPSYEPLEFSEIDTIPIRYDETFQYSTLRKSYEHKVSMLEHQIDYLNHFPGAHDRETREKEIADYQKAIPELKDSLEFLRKNFDFDTTRVCMRHKYRYYDEEEKQHYILSATYYFDKDISRIVGFKAPMFDDDEVYIEFKPK